jgi:hypothetical protein
MKWLRFSIREILLVTLVVALLVGWGAQTYSRKWPSAKEKALMQERLEALRRVVEVQEQLRSMGVGISDNLQTLSDAQDELLAAELELCATSKERVEALEKNLAAHQQHEKIAFARFDQGAGTSTGMHTAKAGRLRAEIALERAKVGR